MHADIGIGAKDSRVNGFKGQRMKSVELWVKAKSRVAQSESKRMFCRAGGAALL
jgi:hypothetical protein